MGLACCPLLGFLGDPRVNTGPWLGRRCSKSLCIWGWQQLGEVGNRLLVEGSQAVMGKLLT